MSEESNKRTIRRCPHCDGLIAVYSEISVQPEDEKDRLDWRTGLAREQIELVETAERTGIMKAFGEAMVEAKKGGIPKLPQRFFLEFLKTAVPRIVPQVCIDELNSVLGGETLQIYGTQGIAMIIAAGELRWFVPYDLLRGKALGGAGIISRSGASRKRLPLDEMAFSQWIRTRHGYVAGRGLFFDAMKKKSIGDYARLVQ